MASSTDVTAIVLALAVVLAALGVAGCVARRLGARGATSFGRREERQLQQQAERDLRCPARQLVLTPLTERVVQVHGCQQLRDYAYSRPQGRGRAAWVPLQPVFARAAAELACPAQALAIQAPGPTVRSASGCGRSARYDLVCGALDCAWMMTAHDGAWGGAVAAAEADGGGAGGPQEIGAVAAEDGGALAIPEPPGAASAQPGAGTSGSASSAAAQPGAGQAAQSGAAQAGAGGEVAGSGAVPATLASDIPEPPAAGSAEALIRALLDSRSAQIHRCAGIGVVPVHASWASDGTVAFALEAPHSGTRVEACVRAMLGAARVAPGAAGELVHPVR